MTSEVEAIPASQVAIGGYRPVLIGLCHGILKDETEPDWTDYGGKFFPEISSRFSVLMTDYFELPFPRVAAIRNEARARAFTVRMANEAKHLQDTFGVPPIIYLGGHSNGGYLIDLVAEDLIALGWKLEGLLFMAAAVRAKRQTLRVMDWIERGALQKAQVVMAMQDRVIGFLKWDPMKIVAWPWGALGREGWHRKSVKARAGWFANGELLERGRVLTEVRLDAKHSDFLSAKNRAETFRAIIGPYFGVTVEEGMAA